MFRKRTVLITCGLVLILAVGLLGFLLAKGAHKSDGDRRVTRFEWIKMLGEQFGIGEYREDSPYFQDVDRQNGYSAYVQSAVEWEILEKEDKFNGDSPVTGEFAVITAMRAIGKYRLQIYLESDKEPDTSDYLRLAYEYELITEERLNAELDETECSAILETVQNLNTQILWKDDYEKVVSKENVLEVEPGNIFGYDAETGQVWMEPASVEKIEAGDIIVFDTGNAGQGRSSLSVDDAWQDAVLFPASNAGYGAVPAASFSAGLQNKGMSFSVASENNLVKIQVTDNNTGVSLEQSFAAGLAEDTAIECSFEVTDIDVGAQVLYEWGSLKYIDVQLYVCLGEKLNVSVVSEEVEIPLGTLTIPLAGGIASVQLQLNLVLSAEGDILITAKIPAGAHFAYEAEKGLRSIPMNLSYTEPQIELSVEIEAAVCPKAVLTVLFLWNAAEMDLKAGVSAGAEMALHSTQTCTDLSVACPVISLGVTVDPILIPPLSKEWELLSKEDAPFRWSRHYEVYQDGSVGFVEVCTYGEQREEESGSLPLPAAAVDVSLDNTYITQHGDTRFAFDYPDTWKISEDESDKFFADQVIHEWVVLKNERGASITYYEWKQDNLGAGGHAEINYWEASQVADTLIESFVVGKVRPTGGVDMITGEEYSLKDGNIRYVVMPQEGQGVHTGTGFSGLYDSFTFSYGSSYYYLMATAPDGKFTEDEEREVLAILSSFRLAEDLLSLDASVTDDSKPVETIEELWAKLDGIWVFEEYTYNGKIVNYPELTMEFSYTDGIPCMHKELRSDIENWSSPPDTLFYEISAVDAEHHDVYYYKKGSYDGTEPSKWGNDTLACWYSIDLTNLSNGELIISPHMTFSNGFTDNYSVFRYRLKDDT